MRLFMFDIDGTLVESNAFDAECYQAAVEDVLGTTIDTNWQRYDNVTDAGILDQILDELRIGEDRALVVDSIKSRFFERIAEYLGRNEIHAVKGAREFLTSLSRRSDAKVALATGGWLTSARLKLQAAGIWLPDIPIASSDDHFSRTAIMETAERRSGGRGYAAKTYFGDAVWDMKACSKLGYDFVLVGCGFAYEPCIADYSQIAGIADRLGL